MNMLSMHETWFGASLTLEIAAQFTVLFMVALAIEALSRNAPPVIRYLSTQSH